MKTNSALKRLIIFLFFSLFLSGFAHANMPMSQMAINPFTRECGVYTTWASWSFGTPRLEALPFGWIDCPWSEKECCDQTGYKFVGSVGIEGKNPNALPTVLLYTLVIIGVAVTELWLVRKFKREEAGSKKRIIIILAIIFSVPILLFIIPLVTSLALAFGWLIILSII